MPYLSSSNFIKKHFPALLEGDFSSLRGFGEEVHRFEWKHNYRFDSKTKRMISPSQLKGKKASALTKFEDYQIKIN